MSEIKDTQQHPNVEIAVENFGPIAKASIDLRPLTVCWTKQYRENLFCYVGVCAARCVSRYCRTTVSVSFWV